MLRYVKDWLKEQIMSFYFSADGTLKYTTNQVAPKGNLSNTASNSSSTSNFSTEMKNAAISNSGKMSPNEKNALLANNADYQRTAALQARINEIASRKPRTFGSTTYTMNLAALKNYNAAIAKQLKNPPTA